jgi:carbamoyl-phosphate synthase small subunit
VVPQTALIALEDGATFRGEALAGGGTVGGELVFTTGMTGYQEVVTDPSYAGQMVTFTFPMVGNYGVARELEESGTAHARAILAREITNYRFNHVAEGAWLEWLAARGVMAVAGVDTRALTRHIRDKGAMRAVVSTEAGAAGELVELARSLPAMAGQDLVRDVTRHERTELEPLGPGVATEGAGGTEADPERGAAHVVAYDYGIKNSILRRLREQGFRVTVVPAETTAAAVLKLSPDGVFLSNGPGDPAAVTYAVRAVGKLLGKVPIFGICLGHQILALSLGMQTYKLPFGHRGSNHPVRDEDTGGVWITTQNHGFAVSTERGVPNGVAISHVNLNDGTVEGLECQEQPAFSVQFHPEASPGPHDALGLFARFAELVERSRDLEAADGHPGEDA